MFIEQLPEFVRQLYPHAEWRKNADEKVVYLTFDDGPIPGVTPWVLEMLDKYGIKATFFLVGDNVRKHPDVYATRVNSLPYGTKINIYDIISTSPWRRKPFKR